MRKKIKNEVHYYHGRKVIDEICNQLIAVFLFVSIYQMETFIRLVEILYVLFILSTANISIYLAAPEPSKFSFSLFLVFFCDVIASIYPSNHRPNNELVYLITLSFFFLSFSPVSVMYICMFVSIYS